MRRWWQKQPKRELLVDLYSKEVVRVWLAMNPDYDLEFEEVGEDSIGERPEWLQYELENIGWDDILGIGYSDDKMPRWGLEEGIAPGQPFLVELPHPHYYSSQTENGTEHDVDFDPDIIRIRPMVPRAVASAWEREWSYIAKARAWKVERDEKQRYLVRTDVNAMIIESCCYFASNQSTWDDMCMPSGIRFSLCSKASIDKKVSGRWTTATLASGEDDEGDHTKAFERLVEEATKQLPGLSAEVVRTLPIRNSHW